ncbi:MAG: hypothetical protein KIH69_013590 [Anaerolineae bacterium]|nr:hypothetical protein [Anaerolineae bacterium]
MKISTQRNPKKQATLISAVKQHGVKGVPAVYRRNKPRQVVNWLQVRYVVPVVAFANIVIYALAR